MSTTKLITTAPNSNLATADVLAYSGRLLRLHTAVGVNAPGDRTAREEKIKHLPLDGLKRLLAVPRATGFRRCGMGLF